MLRVARALVAYGYGRGHECERIRVSRQSRVDSADGWSVFPSRTEVALTVPRQHLQNSPLPLVLCCRCHLLLPQASASLMDAPSWRVFAGEGFTFTLGKLADPGCGYGAIYVEQRQLPMAKPIAGLLRDLVF